MRVAVDLNPIKVVEMFEWQRPNNQWRISCVSSLLPCLPLLSQTHILPLPCSFCNRSSATVKTQLGSPCFHLFFSFRIFRIFSSTYYTSDIDLYREVLGLLQALSWRTGESRLLIWSGSRTLEVETVCQEATRQSPLCTMPDWAWNNALWSGNLIISKSETYWRVFREKPQGW